MKSVLSFAATRLGILILAVVSSTSPATAEIQSVWITPDAPTCRSQVVLHIQGTLPDGCWSATSGKAEPLPAEDRVKITIDAHDRHTRGALCPAVLVPYEFSFDLGMFSAGPRKIEMRETHYSRRSPESPVLQMILSILPDLKNPCPTPNR